MAIGRPKPLVHIGFALMAWATVAPAQPVGTAFTYQGRLGDGGNPANGPFDLQVALFDAAAGGAQVGPLVTRDDVVVTNGLFTLTLDFGTAFGGSARWLELRVRPGASTGAYTTIAPRQELTPSPYAVFTTSAPWGGIAGKPAGFADDVDNDALGVLACSNNQVARFNGSAWVCVADSAHNHLGQTWTGSGLGLRVESTTADGLQGVASAAGTNGVQGSSVSPSGRGVMGVNSATSGFAFGVVGLTDSTTGRGVFGSATATTGFSSGVRGQTVSSQGVGVYGQSLSLEGNTHGVRGDSQSSDGRGVWGLASSPDGETFGVFGESHSGLGRGVRGVASSESGFTIGVEGMSFSPIGTGVIGTASASEGSAEGVRGTTFSSAGTGVSGIANAPSGGSTGVFGLSSSSGGVGVFGLTLASSGSSIGVMGGSSSTTGVAMYGFATSTDGTATGVLGHSSAKDGVAVHGVSFTTTGSGHGVRAESYADAGAGLQAQNYSTTGLTWGVWGIANSTAGRGVQGQSNSSSGIGVYGINSTLGGLAGFFQGDVSVNGTLNKNAGAFKIDHPLDPENKYLYHSFVESPDMMNVYNGNVTLDTYGEAVVRLPEWFEALNRDFRYQLTAIGRPGPGLHVAAKVKDNRFLIAGGSPGQEVSWQVTGIRHDAYAEAHRIPVEEDKKPEDRGRYLQPEAHGQPAERGIGHETRRTPAPRPVPIRPPLPPDRPTGS